MIINQSLEVDILPAVCLCYHFTWKRTYLYLFIDLHIMSILHMSEEMMLSKSSRDKTVQVRKTRRSSVGFEKKVMGPKAYHRDRSRCTASTLIVGSILLSTEEPTKVET